MLPSLLISLREGLEAALVIGMVLGTLNKAGRPGFAAALWQGVAAAAVLSVAAGIGLNLVGASLSGKGENAFEGTSMILAAILITWMCLWVGRQSRARQVNLEAGVRQAASEASRQAVFLLAFLAVLREGTELVFFIFASGLGATAISTAAGTGIGLLLAGFAGWAVFSSTQKLNLRRFFQISNILLLFVAAGLFSRGMHEFIEAGWLTAGIPRVWDLSFVLNDQSFLGQLGASLFGYRSAPSLTEVISYLGYFALVGILFWLTVKLAENRSDRVKPA